MSDPRPNILFIMTDQQRYDSIGCNGADWVQTPNLDRLAREGVVFDNCYVNNTVCTPSRASMFTGKHLPGHGVYQLHDVLPDDEVLFTERLRGSGYRTALFGKLHVSGRIREENHRHPHDGFDIYEWCLEASLSMDSRFNGYSQWLAAKDPDFHARLKRDRRKLTHLPEEYHLTHWAAERSIDYIRNQDGEKPFFCMMSVFDPHNPYDDYPPGTEELVNIAAMPEPVLAPEGGDEPGRVPVELAREMSHSYLGPYNGFNAEDISAMRLGYYASIAFADREIGRVLTALEDSGHLENTIIVFTSDHGDMLGDHNLFVKGGYFHDPCARVPLIIRWPRGRGRFGAPEPGSRVRGLVQLHDLAATVLTAAGIDTAKIAEWMPDSRNIAAETHETAVCCYRNSGICDTGRAWDPPLHATMWYDGRHKLNLYHGDPNRGLPCQGQFFDLVEDPAETHDLWDSGGSREAREGSILSLLDWLHRNELVLGSRGGEATPDPSQQIVNTIK